MTANEAKELAVGEFVEWNDGRICMVIENEFARRQIHLQFGNGSIGIANWRDLSQAVLLESK